MPNDAGRDQRRLAAILAADVVGYSRLIADDESGTLARLKAHRSELIDPAIAKARGRIFKTTGDGLLAEFPSVVDAVACAGEVQVRMAKRNSELPEDRRLLFRIGVSIGDVVAATDEHGADDLHGDGVNQAARLEALAEPGGLCISADARGQLEGRSAIAFEDIGLRKAKPHDKPLHVFRARLDGAAARRVVPSRRPVVLAVASVAAIALAAGAWLIFGTNGPAAPLLAGLFRAAPVEPVEDVRPMMVVLPFANISGDPNQEYFSDGITEDITTALSRFPGFAVIASNLARTYKGKAVKAQDVGRELGVRYMLEGSVQKQGDRLRLNAQLIDTQTGIHVWAEKFDRPMTDIFVVQDELVERIVRTAASHVRRRESERALAAPPEKLEAYDLTLRARLLRRLAGKENTFEARRLLLLAIERDPSFGLAYASLSQVLNGIWVTRWNEEYAAPETMQRMVEAAAKGVLLAPGDPSVRIAQARALTALKQYDEANIEAELAQRLAPNDTEVIAGAVTVLSRSGAYEKAIVLIEKGLAIEPTTSPFLTSTAYSFNLYMLGRYAESARVARQCVQRAPTAQCRLALVASLGQIGPADAAKYEAAELLRVFPGYRISEDMARIKVTYRIADDVDHLGDGLRRAGLPE